MPERTAPIHIDSRLESDTDALAARLAPILRAGDCIALIGDLGAGKTRFVRALAGALGVDPRNVHSPTFVLVNEYRPADPARPPLIHVDAYRLDDADSLDLLAWDRLTAGDAILAVEWADRIRRSLPRESLDIALAHDGDQRRRITISWRDESWARRLADL